ncbi:hypothetical protein [Caldilinea sp.]|jgi:hypothetical protein|uniref:hypothetical protein n=1 Tax=Caldilinea sp. TaxID=2293560 RepID=UPI00260446F3|nr:hypothetical protein [uncultured Caldilinea sp.]
MRFPPRSGRRARRLLWLLHVTTLASLLVMALPSARAQEGASATAEATAAAPTLRL